MKFAILALAMRSFRLFILVFFLSFGNSLLANVVPNDAGITALVSPSLTGCYGNNVAVIVSIQNFGTNALNNIPVSVIISGPINQTITSTFTGVLAAGASTNFTVGNAVMNWGGIYTFNCASNLVGDGNVNNDSFASTRTVSPNVFISGPSVACIGSTSTLNVSGAATYTWSTGSNSNSIAISPTISTTYSVAGTSSAGCVSIYTINLSVQNPTLFTNGGIACNVPSNGTVTANAFSTAIVNWYSSPVSTIVIGTGSALAVNISSTTTFYAEAVSTKPGSLLTTVAGGNSSQGNMFDITAANSMTVDGFDMHFNSNMTTTVEIWYRYGSFIGNELSNSGWTLALTTTLNPAGSGTLSPIPGTLSIPISAGQTAGIYVTSNGGAGVNYTNGTGLGNLFASNSDLQIFEGRGGAYFNVNITPRIFNGIVRYKRPGCQSPRVPATFSIVPGFTVGAISSNSALCAGNGVTLTGVGAVDYTWTPFINLSPSQNASVVVASPTAFTTYTLFGSVPSCSMISSYTLALTVNPSPTITVTPPTAILPGSILTLTAGGASSYTWQPGGANNINIIVNPSVTTVYTVSGTNQFGCISAATTTVSMTAIGMDELSFDDHDWKIYPNPVIEELYLVNGKIKGKFIIELFSADGKRVCKQNLSSENISVDTKNFNSGIYQYKISSENNDLLKSGKIMIVK